MIIAFIFWNSPTVNKSNQKLTFKGGKRSQTEQAVHWQVL